MLITAKFKNLIQYTILATTTAQTIAETAKVPFLGSTSALCLSITKGIETTKLNKEECAEIMEHIHEILCIIVQLHSTSEIKGVLPTAVLYDIAKFTEALERLFTIVNGQQKDTLGKIKGLFRQPEAAERLEKCKQELSRMVELFKAQVTDTDSDLTSSDRSSVTGTLAKLENNSSGSFGLLPPSPQIFHGREAELQDVVDILVQDSAHIAILGTGGMGKTSIATAALHNQLVESKYSHRYFVPCHSSPTCTELVATIAGHIGLEKGSNMAQKIAHHFAHAPPSLLILDNLETPWESLSSRSEVEEFLSLLTDVPHLGLMITLRGAERPSKTFYAVADDGHDDVSVTELLELTGNLPLAVSLIASVADSEGCAKALSRWKSESTWMLSDGYDQRSSLDISIMLSYTSPRMTPGSQELLSILSMLPDGLADADLNLKVLVPIRKHILHVYPPAIALKLQLREHFHQILGLWNQFKNLNVADIHPQISQNLSNFNTVLHDGLQPEGPDIIQNLTSILFLNDFCYRVQGTYSPLLLQLAGTMRDWKDNPIWGEYLIELLKSSQVLPTQDLNGDIILGTQHFKSKNTLEQARWYRALGIYFWVAKSDLVKALKSFQRAYSLAESMGYPTTIGIHALTSICNILTVTGKPLSALTHAKEAYRDAEHMGDIYAQAWSFYHQARCYAILANYWHAQHLLQKSRDMLTTCGQQESQLAHLILNHQAEVHLVKSEYLESRKLQVTIAASRQPTSYSAIQTNLNIACIDIATSVDSKIIHKNLGVAQSHSNALYGYYGRQSSIFSDYAAAELFLRDGVLDTAPPMFEKCFASSQDFSADLGLLCLERLRDLSTGMNYIPNTLRWGGVFLSLALKCKDKRQTMQAFRCLGQIFSAQGDNETALSLFNVALHGFTLIHGEVMKAIELWKAARPLFERSSQMKDIIKIDAKLGEVDSAILVEQLQQLSELDVPGSAPEETYIVEDEEEEENKVAEGSDVGDTARQGVLL
ncbi:hypothetical protein C8J57DRAFT_1721217 [Mycena rebaudengoi]|nr:hypothetical protein C8J57DRAFT_1721217 [Mycena rebaudengoi]